MFKHVLHYFCIEAMILYITQVLAVIIMYYTLYMYSIPEHLLQRPELHSDQTTLQSQMLDQKNLFVQESPKSTKKETTYNNHSYYMASSVSRQDDPNSTL